MPRFALIAFAVIALASCTSNKDLLISSQGRELHALNAEVNALKRERAKQDNIIRELEAELETCRGDDLEGGTPPTGITAVASELSVLQKRSITGLQSFLNGGIERQLFASSAQLDAAIAHARSYIGTPHKQGGTSHRGIDCSGLVHVALEQAGLGNLPRTANDFARYGTVIVNPEHLNRGDLVFFTNTYNTSKFITHIGIYLGGNQFIHASSSKGVVTSSLMDGSYWQEHYVFGTRLSR